MARRQRLPSVRSGTTVAGQQVGEREPAEAEAEGSEPVAAVRSGIHRFTTQPS
jgi:hypothetical protein